MEKRQVKYKLPVITAEVFKADEDRYELRKGTLEGAPPCPYGHRFKWIGFDKKSEDYVRVTKSVFKRLINTLDRTFVDEHEAHFQEANDSGSLGIEDVDQVQE